MTEILSLLFHEYTKSEYTRNLNAYTLKEVSDDAQAKYQQLKELAGEETALDIWDAAVGQGAAAQEICFQAGLKTGIAFALELVSL